MERTVLFTAFGLFMLVLLVLVFVQKDKQPTGRERKETAERASVFFAVEALQAAFYAIGGAVLAVVMAVLGEWKIAAIAGGAAVFFGTIAAVQRGLAGEERKRLD